MALRPIHGLSLCSGAGALDLGLSLALRGRYHAVAYVERDPFAAATLVARMGDQALREAPVWDDLCTFDGRPWRGRVDCVTAGFPCQPFSAAGQRRGLDDDRWLWPDVARVVREVAPRLVFVENVRGFLAEHGGVRHVLGDLADLGFDAEWEVLSAAEVGASHRRERFWLLGWRDVEHAKSLLSGHGAESTPAVRGGRLEQQAEPGAAGSEVADAGGFDPERRGGAGHMAGSSREAEGEARQRERGGDAVGDRSEDVADAGVGGRDGGPRFPRRSEVERTAPEGTGPGLANPLFPPGPDELDRWADVVRRAPGLEPAVHRMADGLAHRLERSHLIGNGVVPLVAAAAFRRLAHRAGVLT